MAARWLMISTLPTLRHPRVTPGLPLLDITGIAFDPVCKSVEIDVDCAFYNKYTEHPHHKGAMGLFESAEIINFLAYRKTVYPFNEPLTVLVYMF